MSGMDESGKVEFFMWLALLGKLNTKEMLWKKGILQEDQTSCPLCLVQLESLDHILLNCPVSWSIWCKIAGDLGQSLRMAETFRNHFEGWMTRHRRNVTLKKLWCSTFFAIAWSLRLMRNGISFQHKVIDVDALYNIIRWRVTFWTKAWKEQLSYNVDDVARNFDSIPVLFH